MITRTTQLTVDQLFGATCLTMRDGGLWQRHMAHDGLKASPPALAPLVLRWNAVLNWTAIDVSSSVLARG
ncbi:MAG: hypothetical protein IPN04_06955 [Rhodoferax sp.]|nr:hypothetical protein [Rhodoferax sp.]